MVCLPCSVPSTDNTEAANVLSGKTTSEKGKKGNKKVHLGFDKDQTPAFFSDTQQREPQF